MIKNTQYLYLGENGSILSPVRLSNVYHVKKYKLIADANCKITKDNIHFYDSIIVPESEVDEWHEVKGQE